MSFHIRINFGKNKPSARGKKKEKQPPAEPLPGVQAQTKERQAGKSERDYAAWILEHLPAELPAYARAAAEELGGRVQGLKFWVPGDREPVCFEYNAKSEADLQYWLFREACTRAALKIELRSRRQDELRYRFVMDHAEDGRWIYRQNPGYEYDTIHDSRKVWMELALRMALPVLPPEEGQAFVEKYERLLNNCYRTPRWGYDRGSGVFREISDSPRLDWNGVEQPAPGTVIGVDHP